MSFMITTEDNPHDPRTDFDSWFAWDVFHGYNTCAYLSRISAVSEGFPAAVQDRQVEMAIDEILELHGGKLYKKLEVS